MHCSICSCLYEVKNFCHYLYHFYYLKRNICISERLVLFVYPQFYLRFKLWAPIRLFPSCLTLVGTEGGGGHGLHFLCFKAGGYRPQPPKQGAGPCLFDHMAYEREVIRNEKTLLWVRTCMISHYSSLNPLLVQKICVKSYRW